MLLYELGAISEDGWNSRRPVICRRRKFARGSPLAEKHGSARFSSREIIDYLDQLRVPTE